MSSSFSGDPNNFIQESYIFPENDPAEYDVKLRQYLNRISSAVNTKDSGLYTDEEIITGQKFLPIFGTDGSTSLVYRDVFRKVIDFGALPDTTTKTVPHGISTTQDYSIVRFYGSATNPGVTVLSAGLSLPYVNVTTPTDGVQLDIFTNDISITTTTSNYTSFIRTFITLEYIKVI